MEFVGELVARTAAAGAFRIAALDHEIRNYAMKNSAVVKGLAGLAAVRQRDEVFHGAGRFIGEQFGFELALGGIEESVGFVRHSRIVAGGLKRG